MSNEDKDFSELLEEYQDQNELRHFEGDSGLDNLNNLCEAIGYAGHDFKYGSNLEEFLSDNPGACTALVEWIAENGDRNNEWREKLTSNLAESDEE